MIMIYRPAARSGFAYMIYCDLVCNMKILRAKKLAFAKVEQERGVQRRVLVKIYDRTIRRSLAAGMAVKDLF